MTTGRNAPPRTSLIIPTFDRPDELARCLRSVARVDPGFDEVIVVDSGDAARTRAIAGRFDRLHVDVVPHPAQSAARARNAGIERAGGEFVFFVDDDTELEPRYVAAALAGFERHPHAVGLTGPDRTVPAAARRAGAAPRRWLWGSLHRLLLDTPLYRASVLRSGAFGRGLLRRPHERQWLHGHHAAYRRRVFDEGLRFNPDFRRWSYNEDAMLSYQAYKRYGAGSLRFVPEFRLLHHASDTASLPCDVQVRMMVIYRFVFWYEEVYGGSLVNLLCYLYGQTGFALRLWRVAGSAGLPAVGSAYRFLLRHWRAVVDKRIDYNHFVLHGAAPAPVSRPPVS